MKRIEPLEAATRSKSTFDPELAGREMPPTLADPRDASIATLTTEVERLTKIIDESPAFGDDIWGCETIEEMREHCLRRADALRGKGEG